MLQKLGIGRTMSSLPAGVGLSSAIALLFPVWQVIVLVRGIDAVLRNSLFRSGYELFFVPMDAAERRRIKTFIDVTCDRAGEALGAIIVQVFLFTSVVFLTGELWARSSSWPLARSGLGGGWTASTSASSSSNS